MMTIAVVKFFFDFLSFEAYYLAHSNNQVIFLFIHLFFPFFQQKL